MNIKPVVIQPSIQVCTVTCTIQMILNCTVRVQCIHIIFELLVMVFSNFLISHSFQNRIVKFHNSNT